MDYFYPGNIAVTSAGEGRRTLAGRASLEYLVQALGAEQAQPLAHLQLGLQPQLLPQVQRSTLALAQPQDAFSQLQRV